ESWPRCTERMHRVQLRDALSRRFANFARIARRRRGMAVAEPWGMSVAPFPHHYTVSLSGDELLALPRAPIAAGAPPQFGGSEDVWSPEELLAGAVLLCLQTTFAAFAKRASLRVLDWQGRITAT